jgi:beta-D-galactosyl-(1->4)-L-rhamnose phosphorylase
VPKGVKVIINAGRDGSAWSGGFNWQEPKISALLTSWVQKGGGLLGVAEPSASATPGSLFRLAHVLGLDRDRGERLANGKFKYTVPPAPVAPHFITADLVAAPDFGKDIDGIYVHGPATSVLADKDGSPRIATHEFGKGRSAYFSGFRFTHENTRLLHRALFWAAAQEAKWTVWQTSNIRTEAAWFGKAKKLVVINNAGEPQETVLTLGDGRTTKPVSLAAHGIAILDV